MPPEPPQPEDGWLTVPTIAGPRGTGGTRHTPIFEEKPTRRIGRTVQEFAAAWAWWRQKRATPEPLGHGDFLRLECLLRGITIPKQEGDPDAS